MTTTTINPGTKNGSNSAAKVSMAGAAAAATIVAGAAAYSAIKDDDNTDDVLTADAGNAAETTEETAQATEESAQTSAQTAQATEHQQATPQTNTNEHVDGPAPVTEDVVTPEPVAPQPVTPEPVSPENVTQNTTTTASDIVDPNDIAQNIIAGEEIDPTDVDDADVLDFASVGTVYGTDGEEYNAAIIEDPTGEQMMMVDVNNDGTYDVVADAQGNVIAEVPAGTNITTSDAELEVNPDPTYLAQNDSDISSMAVDDIANDILSI